MDAYDRIQRDIKFFRSTLAEVVKLIERMEEAEGSGMDAYYWGFGTMRVKEELRKLSDGDGSPFWG